MKTTMSGRMTWGGVWLSVMAAVSLVGLATPPPSAGAQKSIEVTAGEAVTITLENVAAVGIAEPAIADIVKMGETPVYSIIGKKAGVTTLTVVFTDGKEGDLYRVEVAQSAGVRSIHRAVSSPGVTVQEIGDAVVLEGKVKTELEAERAVKIAGAYKANVVNLIEVTAPRRVRIRGRLVEIRTSAIKKLGIEYFGSNGEVVYRYGRGVTEEPGSAAVSGHGFFDPDATGLQTISAASIPAAIEARLKALASKNLARVLSEPTLVTLSGKEASFLSGGEVPIVQTLANSSTVEFKEFGVRLKIKPVVDSENNITSHVMAEVSDAPTIPESGIPNFVTRRAETVVQVKDGQTIVIGGLLSNERSRDAIRKVPWLGDIPVLGVLFRSKDYQHGLTELLVLVTLDVLKDIDAEVANAAATPAMKQWNGGQADAELRQELPVDPKWQKPLEVDELLKLRPAEPESSDAPAGTSTEKSDPTSNFSPAEPAGK